MSGGGRSSRLRRRGVLVAACVFLVLACGAALAFLVRWRLEAMRQDELLETSFGRVTVAAPVAWGDTEVRLIQEDDGNLVRAFWDGEPTGSFGEGPIPDIAGLRDINPDAYAWVYLPHCGDCESGEHAASNIDYYVMREPAGLKAGEYKYIWTDIYGNESKWGSIFTPYVPDGGGEGMTELFFGHRMKDRSVAFSNLKLFLEPDYLEAHPYVYVYREGRAERYAVWAAFNADYMDGIYRIYPAYEAGSGDYGELIRHVGEDLASARTDREVTADDRLLFLSTCYQDDTRMVVACVLDKVYDYDTVADVPGID